MVVHMPRISRFFGITIAMFYNDHAPPHFHAFYAEYVKVPCHAGRWRLPWNGRRFIEAT